MSMDGLMQIQSGKRDHMVNGKHLKQKKKPEFSKIMAVISTAMWLGVNVFGLVMIARTYDLTPLAYVIGSVDAVQAAIVSFYLLKARTENEIKLNYFYNAPPSVNTEMPPIGAETWGK